MAHLRHVRIAARVIDVPVRVDDESHRAVRQRCDGSKDFRRQRRELDLDDVHRVDTDSEADVATLAAENVDAVSECSVRIWTESGSCARAAGCTSTKSSASATVDVRRNRVSISQASTQSLPQTMASAAAQFSAAGSVCQEQHC